MKKAKKFFLPMEENAIKCLQMFMDADIAEALIKFHALDDKKDWDVEFPKLEEAAKKFNECLDKMKKEAQQLFEYTAPHIHKIIASQYQEDVNHIAKLLSKKNVIERVSKNIKTNNDRFENEEESARIVSIGKDNKPIRILTKKFEMVDPAIIDQSHFQDYLNTLNILFDDFKAECNFFINEDENSYRRSIGIKPIGASGFVESDLKSNITDWDRFIKICDWFSEPREYRYTTKETKTKSGQNFRKATPKIKPVIIRIGIEDYKWDGLGGPTESLRGFLQKLWDEELFEYHYFVIQTQLASEFFRFFKMSSNNPLYVFHHFEKSVSKYKKVFDLPLHLQKANYSSQLK